MAAGAFAPAVFFCPSSNSFRIHSEGSGSRHGKRPAKGIGRRKKRMKEVNFLQGGKNGMGGGFYITK